MPLGRTEIDSSSLNLSLMLEPTVIAVLVIKSTSHDFTCHDACLSPCVLV